MKNHFFKILPSFALIFILSFLINTTEIFSQDDDKEMKFAKAEWQQIYDAYAVKAILLISKRDSLSRQIDSLKTLDSIQQSNIISCEAEIYSLLGTTKEQLAEYRIKFDETERAINGRIGSPESARKNYFDEISGNNIKCLGEFSDRFASMKKKMDDWEGIKSQEIVKTEIPQEKKYSYTGNTYTVERGDNLRIISLYEYGDAGYWTVIWEANKNGIANKEYFYKDENRYLTDPDKIYPGQILYIPSKPETP